MTTAARPTWLPAVGGGSLRDTGGAPTLQVSAKALNAHTFVKLRQQGQNAPGEILDRNQLKLKLLAAEKAAKNTGIQVDEHELEDKRKELLSANLDADDDVDGDECDSNEEQDPDLDDSGDSDDDTDDDEAELMRELEKIKRERAEEKERLERDKREEEERVREEAMLAGNPLLNGGASVSASSAIVVSGGFAVKRRWDDDVIFKNQARGVEERPKKRFVNDLLRSDFHRKFMSKCGLAKAKLETMLPNT
ncbi:UNVERIFIED_CONTAM: hypothetical protein HDU68_009394 [Siphonaria sp. JEL0065]|nr:hypothetical protein HDU68_009394 [Siphonaria sp. JEL0065]